MRWSIRATGFLAQPVKRPSRMDGEFADQRRAITWYVVSHGGDRLAAGEQALGADGKRRRISQSSSAGRLPVSACRSRLRMASDLLRMQGWEMAVPNYKDGNHDVLYDRRPTDDPSTTRWAPTSPRPRTSTTTAWGRTRKASSTGAATSLHCEHDYNAPSGQSVCVPFVVTNKGYGIVWDNPSKTTVAFGFNDSVNWKSQVGPAGFILRHRGQYLRRDLRGDTAS